MNTSFKPRHFLLLVLALVAGFASGCKREDSAVPVPTGATSTSTASTAFTERLNSALAISDSIKRDGALAVIADSAAQAGDATVVQRAVAQISDSIQRDAATESSALALAKAGKLGDAVKLARTMSDSIKRDSVLSKLARP